jgi:hypothetical protein
MGRSTVYTVQYMIYCVYWYTYFLCTMLCLTALTLRRSVFIYCNDDVLLLNEMLKLARDSRQFTYSVHLKSSLFSHSPRWSTRVLSCDKNGQWTDRAPVLCTCSVETWIWAKWCFLPTFWISQLSIHENVVSLIHSSCFFMKNVLGQRRAQSCEQFFLKRGYKNVTFCAPKNGTFLSLTCLSSCLMNTESIDLTVN